MWIESIVDNVSPVPRRFTVMFSEVAQNFRPVWMFGTIVWVQDFCLAVGKHAEFLAAKMRHAHPWASGEMPGFRCSPSCPEDPTTVPEMAINATNSWLALSGHGSDRESAHAGNDRYQLPRGKGILTRDNDGLKMSS